jgi:hypothetical protein
LGLKFTSSLKTRQSRVKTCYIDVNQILAERIRTNGSAVDEWYQIGEGLQGNFIINIPILEHNFNSCYQDHRETSPECHGLLTFDPNCRKWGPGMLSAMLVCCKCSYTSNFLKYYEEVTVTGRRNQGRLSSKVGVQMQVATSKQPIGNAALRRILASCDISPGTSSGMQKASNRVMDKLIVIDEEQLADNRRYVKATMRARTGEDEPAVLVEADNSYNSFPKGRGFYQPGTQTWQPVFSAEPGLNLPIAMGTASKLCSCVVGQGQQHRPDCTNNYNMDRPIGNAELDLAKDSALKIMAGPPSSTLSVRAVVTDGDGKIAKGFKCVAEELHRHPTPQKADCTRHLTKTIGRNINKLNLSVTGRTLVIRTEKKRKLAYFIEKRCALEFRAAHAKYRRRGIDFLVEKCGEITEGIIGCITGEVDICVNHTLVCKHKKNKEYKIDAPYLNRVDETAVRRWIGNKLGAVAVIGQQDNHTTNRCEASHLTTTKSVPKSRTYRRNFKGRVHSATHSMTFGEIASNSKINQILGATNVFLKARETLMRIEENHRIRRKSLTYIRRRKRLRVLRKRRKIPSFEKDNYATGCEDPIVRKDHSYQMA